MSSKLLKLSSKNQITLPKKIVDRFPDTEYFEIETRDEEVILRPARIAVRGETLKRVREKIKKLGLTEDIIHEAIAYVRAGNK
jgi:hypothetical protein